MVQRQTNKHVRAEQVSCKNDLRALGFFQRFFFSSSKDKFSIFLFGKETERCFLFRIYDKSCFYIYFMAKNLCRKQTTIICLDNKKSERENEKVKTHSNKLFLLRSWNFRINELLVVKNKQKWKKVESEAYLRIRWSCNWNFM